MIYRLFFNKSFLPVALSVLTIFLILILRPSFLIRHKDYTPCPYCINPWLVTLIVLIVGSLSYYMINKNMGLKELFQNY